MGFGHFPLFKQLLLSLSTALKEQQEIEEFFLKEFGHFPLSKQGFGHIPLSKHKVPVSRERILSQGIWSFSPF